MEDCFFVALITGLICFAVGMFASTLIWKGVEKHWVKMVADLKNKNN